MRRVSFQGERGAYSEDAARGFFGGEIETVPCATFADALGAAEDGRTEYAVLPVENSIEGSVGESNDLLYGTGLCVVGEIYHKIEHCLIGTGELGDVRTVYSHPQAIGQCRRFIQDRGMRTVPTYDTAGSVGIVKGIDRADTACIASRSASGIHGVPVIREGIADEASNHTRFLILSRSGRAASNHDKTSVIFSVRHEPGALHGVLERFHKSGVNLTKIESRPRRGSAWEYNFYVDFEGSAGDARISRMLEDIRSDTLFFKLLGSYPAG